jgi:hypothetical protein
MKLIKSIFAIAVFFAINTVSAQAITDKWKQMKDYHELLSKTFHPAEEGNLNPIKVSSEDLVARAELLDVTTMPQELRAPKLDENIALLKMQTKKVSELITNKAPNAEIMRAFENLHDIFHRIIKMSELRD